MFITVDPLRDGVKEVKEYCDGYRSRLRMKNDRKLKHLIQKFGQEFLKKLRGKKLPNKLLEKVRPELMRSDISGVCWTLPTDRPLCGCTLIISSSLLGVRVQIFPPWDLQFLTTSVPQPFSMASS